MTALRSYLFTALLVATTGVLGIVGSPALLFGRDGAGGVARLWAKLILFLLRFVAGVRYRLEGADHIPRGAALIAVNHQSMWETVALSALLPKPAMVLKRELLRVPFFGWWAVASGGVAIDRGAGARTIRSLKKATEERIAEGRQLVIFPEGTRGRPGELGPLQPGVAAMYLVAGTPLTPVIHNSGRHWLHPGMMKKPGTITIRFLAPIPPGLTRARFMAALEAALRQARNLAAPVAAGQ